jgi:hypothetical protein
MNPLRPLAKTRRGPQLVHATLARPDRSTAPITTLSIWPRFDECGVVGAADRRRR